MPDAPTQGSLPVEVRDRLAVFHDCPVCAVDRVALGHYIASTTEGDVPSDALPLAAPYTQEELVQHIMHAGPSDRGIGWRDEVEPF
jgi:hypothetical protein